MHIYSVESITTMFTPKLPHSPPIHSMNWVRKTLSLEAPPFFHDSVCEFSNMLTLWITLVQFMANKFPCMFDWVHIEFSYNASSVWSGVIIHKIRPVGQWMINGVQCVCVNHIVILFSAL